MLGLVRTGRGDFTALVPKDLFHRARAKCDHFIMIEPKKALRFTCAKMEKLDMLVYKYSISLISYAKVSAYLRSFSGEHLAAPVPNYICLQHYRYTLLNSCS